MVQQGQSAHIQCAVYAHQIFLFDLRIVADQLACYATILGKYQQSRRIDVESPGWCKTLEVARLEALAIRSDLRFGGNQGYGRLVSILGLAGNIAYRLVQQDRRLPRLGGTRFRRQGHHRIRRGAGTQLRHPLPVDEDQAPLDEGISLAPRA